MPNAHAYAGGMMLSVTLSEVLKQMNFIMPSDEGFLNFELTGFSSLDRAGSHDVSFWTGDEKTETGLAGNAGGVSASAFAGVCAGLLFVPKVYEKYCVNGRSELLPNVHFVCPVENPYHEMVTFLREFVECREVFEPTRIAATAHVHASAVVEGVVGENVVVGPNCVVMKGATIGAGTVLEANVTVYPRVTIGEDCVFQAGSVIGPRGFGFYEYKGKRRMVPHLAGVRIGNRCSFSANDVVAAGFVSPTVIGDDCHFDTFVQIAHNCVLGNNIFMASQSGVAGSVVMEDDVEFAGGVQSAGHLTIGKGVKVAAKAGVTKSLKAGKVYAGYPAEEIDVWRRSVVKLRMMGKK